MEVNNQDTNIAQNMNQNVNNNQINKINNTCALISFIFSMIGIVIFGIICGAVATVTGIIGITTFNQEREKNKWMAITGLSVGIAEVVIMILYYMMQNIV